MYLEQNRITQAQYDFSHKSDGRTKNIVIAGGQHLAVNYLCTSYFAKKEQSAIPKIVLVY